MLGGLRTVLQEHLPPEDLQRLFKTGQAFRGKIRMNASDRREVRRTVQQPRLG